MNTSVKERKNTLYRALKADILTMVLRPGTDLDEVNLSEAYALSRTPLREVLRQLGGEGYVELRENKGARVSEMSHTTLRHFFIAAPMIYSSVLQLAASNASNNQLQELKAAQKKFKEALINGSDVDRALANNHFHEITGEMADNIYLLPSFHRLLIDHARIGITFYRPKDQLMRENLVKADHQHDQIIKAIENQDSEEASVLAVEHWNLSRNQIELYSLPSSLDIPIGVAPVFTAGGVQA